MSDFEILDKDEEVSDEDMLYGFGEYTVTKEDVEALLKGQKLYGTINDEYAFTIELGGNNE